ncbi:MAG TPA: hypothetical protein VGV69_00505 [Solirubrobacterales bacterium]|nr:hypothetical protein [Solirubrobacterales bacterium]
MSRGLRRQGPALVVAGVALVAAMSGTVYAAKKIDGHSIKAKSIPGNRLAVGSVPGNRLKPGAIQGGQLAPGSITGVQIDVSTLGTVPSAVHSETAQSAREAETAQNAVEAKNAESVGGYKAGCESGTRYFAGACWQIANGEAALNAPDAAASCAAQGGELPDALSLAAFSQQQGIALAVGDEWTGDLTNVSGLDTYAVITVSAAGQINFVASTTTKKFRCVIPLLG